MSDKTSDPGMAARSTDFWFLDGSVVVVVEDTAFKLHQSILGKHSDVFADMFVVPQPLVDAETIDNCPVVRLNDALIDFLDVLKALYEPFHFDNLPQTADLLSLIKFVSGMLRVSTKYNFRALRDKCISVLKTRFPTTLAGCDMLLGAGYKYSSSTVVRAIPLARVTNVPEILPWAFYISTNIPTDSLLDDPTLSWHDKALCLAGRERLWDLQKSLTHRFLFDSKPSPACSHPCQSRSSQSMHWRKMEDLRSSPHPLQRFDEWDSLKLCPSCLDMAQKQHQRGREELWGLLPVIFRLGTWPDIHQEQSR